jgi:hypothetical protein
MENVPRLTHCPHIDGLRISTGLVPECSLSATYVNNAVDNSSKVCGYCGSSHVRSISRVDRGPTKASVFVGETRSRGLATDLLLLRRRGCIRRL